jgi:hypothetical protein
MAQVIQPGRFGRFTTPEPNLMIHIRDRSATDELLGLLIYDGRDQTQVPIAPVRCCRANCDFCGGVDSKCFGWAGGYDGGYAPGGRLSDASGAIPARA